MTFSAFNASTHPIVLLADWNYLLAEALEKPITYLVRASGAYYEALDGSTGKLTYGGSTNEGAVDGTDVDAVQQAAIDGTTNGIVFLKDLARGTVTNADGVWVVSETDGYINYYVTNPTSELSAQTNNNNKIMFGILAEPTNVTVGECWTAFTSEIVGNGSLGPGAKLISAGYFGAKGVSGDSCGIFGINPLIRMDLGFTGDGIGCEVDVANEAANGKGVGLLVTGDGAFIKYYGIHVKDDGAGWYEGITTEDCINYNNYAVGDPLYGLYAGDVETGGDADFMLMKAFTATAYTVTCDPSIVMRKRTPEGAVADDTPVLQFFIASEAEPKLQINSSGIYFGAGGASAVDTGLYRIAANQWALPDDTLSSIMSAAADDSFTAQVSGDGAYRFLVEATGAIYWGDGTNPGDVTLYRTAANTLNLGPGDRFGRTIAVPAALGVGVTTFAVDGEIMVITGDGGGNTIGTITGGATGMELTLIFVDGLVTITDTDAHTANTVDLAGNATNLVSADDTVLTLIFDGTSWYEKCRSVNS